MKPNYKIFDRGGFTMKKAGIITGVALILISMFLFSGCTKSLDELRDKNEEMSKAIEDMTDEVNNLKEKAASLVSEAEENWELLQECIAEKQKEKDESIVVVAAVDPAGSGVWTLLESTENDITGDEVSETISMYTSAVKDEAGNLMWDDGQYFLVTVKKGDKTFTLFNERVQIGRVYFTVFAGDTSGVFITMSSFSGIRFEQYIYNQEEDSFIGTTLYSTEGLNVVYSTMPWD